MLVGVLMRSGKLLFWSLRSSRHAPGDAGEDAASAAADAANGEGEAGRGGAGGKATVAVAVVNGDHQAASPWSKARRLPSFSSAALLLAPVRLTTP
jgi:hypothetical protein